MYTINLSRKQLKAIQQKKKKTKDKRIYRRLQCLWLKNKGIAHKDIAETLGVSRDTITDWLKIYLTQGLDGLCQPINYDRRGSGIDPYVDDIKQTVKERTVSTLAELRAILKDEFDLDLESSWLSRCCKKNAIYLTRRPG